MLSRKQNTWCHCWLCVPYCKTGCPEIILFFMENTTYWLIHTHIYTLLNNYQCKQYCGILYFGTVHTLSGLWKSHGFPALIMDSSSQKFLDFVTAPSNVDPVVAQRVRYMFVKSFCREYYKRNQSQAPSPRHWGRYQIWTMEGGRQYWLARVWVRQHFSWTHLWVWLLCRSVLLTDKAICSGLRCWAHSYDRDCYKTVHGRNSPFHKSDRYTRVLHEYLFNPHHDTKDIITKISQGTVDERDFIVEAVPKENELQRLKAHFFAKLTYPMRLYQTATEANIAKQIFTLFDNQSMMMPEDALTHCISVMNSSLNNATLPKYLFIGLDYQDWCKSTCSACTTPTLEQFDKLFGFEHVITFSQNVPHHCPYILQDRFHPPMSQPSGFPEDSNRSTRFATRWLEGMRQGLDSFYLDDYWNRQ